jgi:hypothetical protein
MAQADDPEVTRSEYLELRARFIRVNLVPPDDFFGFYAGQPAKVREEFKQAMGLRSIGIELPVSALSNSQLAGGDHVPSPSRKDGADNSA